MTPMIDPFDATIKFVTKCVMGMIAIILMICRSGFGWLVIGLFLDYAMHAQYAPSGMNPDPVMYASSGTAHILCFWGIAIGFTALHFINRVLSKKAGKKTNLLFWLIERVIKSDRDQSDMKQDNVK